ncbi:MAG: hypothetical protein Q9207_001407 [Kuettlingeria erythrocarpa]
MSNLASTLSDQGRLDEAASMKQEVLEKRRRILGDEHPDTITAMKNLANTLSDQGQLDKAASMQQEVLEKTRRILGDEHPNTTSAMSNLANTLSDQGRLDEAASMRQEVLEESRRILGDEHPNTITAMSNLASTLSHQGRLDDAVLVLLYPLKAMHRLLAQDHPSTISTMRKLAILLGSRSDQGLTTRALGKWQTVASLHARSLVIPNHPGLEEGTRRAMRDKVVDELREFADSSDRFVEVRLAWDVPCFWSRECCEGQHLGSVLVLTGDGLNVQATTCASYVNDHWPSFGDSLLNAINELFSSKKNDASCQY